MRHLKNGRKLNRTSSHRKAMFKNMSLSLIRHKKIETTLPKAKELREFIEPLVTLAKYEIEIRSRLLTKEFSQENEEHKLKAKIVSLRRRAFCHLHNKRAIKELFERIAPKYKARIGGYTRILKSGYRFGDKAPQALIEFVDFN